MTRFDHIKKKFEYVERLRQELMDLSFAAKKEEIEANSIILPAGIILSESRECFDYCYKDIFEGFILSNTTVSDIVSDYKSGGLKLYYPIYASQFQHPVLSELAIFKPDLYKHLLELTKKIANNDTVPNTLYRYGSILELKDMVNEKKHDKLLAVKSDPLKEILIENKSFHAIFPLQQQIPLHTLRVSENSKVKLVDEFLFEFNNVEVSYFCMTALFVTRIVLNEIYQKFFGKSFL